MSLSWAPCIRDMNRQEVFVHQNLTVLVPPPGPEGPVPGTAAWRPFVVEQGIVLDRWCQLQPLNFRRLLRPLDPCGSLWIGRETRKEWPALDCQAVHVGFS